MVSVPVRRHTDEILQKLARKSGEGLPDALDRIVEEARRSQMFTDASEAYAAVAADPAAATAWRAENTVWDVTTGDGLPMEPESPDER